MRALTLQAAGLAVHVLNYDIIDLAEAGAVFQNLPGLICMKMDLDEFFVANCQKTITGKMFCEVVADNILVQISSLD